MRTQERGAPKPPPQKRRRRPDSKARESTLVKLAQEDEAREARRRARRLRTRKKTRRPQSVIGRLRQQGVYLMRTLHPNAFSKPEIAVNETSQSMLEAYSITDRHLQRFRFVFDDIDVDGSGLIDYEELLEALDEPKSPFAERFFETIDANSDGTLGFDEFLQFVMSYSIYSKAEIEKFAFGCYDKDGSGTIDESEFIAMLGGVSNSDPAFPGSFMKAIEQFDVNADGIIDFEEFKELLRRYPILIFPAFRLQMNLQRVTLGEMEWNRLLTYKKISEINAEYAREHDGFPPPKTLYERVRDAVIGEPYHDLKRADPTAVFNVVDTRKKRQGTKRRVSTKPILENSNEEASVATATTVPVSNEVVAKPTERVVSFSRLRVLRQFGKVRVPALPFRKSARAVFSDLQSPRLANTRRRSPRSVKIHASTGDQETSTSTARQLIDMSTGEIVKEPSGDVVKEPAVEVGKEPSEVDVGEAPTAEVVVDKVEAALKTTQNGKRAKCRHATIGQRIQQHKFRHSPLRLAAQGELLLAREILLDGLTEVAPICPSCGAQAPTGLHLSICREESLRRLRSKINWQKRHPELESHLNRIRGESRDLYGHHQLLRRRPRTAMGRPAREFSAGTIRRPRTANARFHYGGADDVSPANQSSSPARVRLNRRRRRPASASGGERRKRSPSPSARRRRRPTTAGQMRREPSEASGTPSRQADRRRRPTTAGQTRREPSEASGTPFGLADRRRRRPTSAGHTRCESSEASGTPSRQADRRRRPTTAGQTRREPSGASGTPSRQADRRRRPTTAGHTRREPSRNEASWTTSQQVPEPAHVGRLERRTTTALVIEDIHTLRRVECKSLRALQPRRFTRVGSVVRACGDWELCLDPIDRPYYFNTKSGLSSWECPVEVKRKLVFDSCS